MYCRTHSHWDCANPDCFGFYRDSSYSHGGMSLDYNLSTGGVDVVENLGGGLGFDLSTGDMVIETPFGDFDI